MSDLTKKEKLEKLAKRINKHNKERAAAGNSKMKQTGRFGFLDDMPEEYRTIQRFSTGSPLMDDYLGGGIPRGVFTNLWGKEGSFKTTVGQSWAAYIQSAYDGIYEFINAEEVLDADLLRNIGVNTAETILVEEPTLEDAFDIVRDDIAEGLIDICMLDSVDASVSKKDIQNKSGTQRSMEEDTIATKPKLLSKFYPTVAHNLKTTQAAFITICQVRTKGIGGFRVYEGQSGGKAKDHYNSLDLKFSVSRSEDKWIKDSDGNVVAKPLKIKCVKSKISGIREGDVLETYVVPGYGIIKEFDWVQWTINQGDTFYLKQKNQQIFTYTDSKGQEHHLRGIKPFKVYENLRDENLLDDFLIQAKGFRDGTLPAKADTPKKSKKKEEKA